MEEEFKKADIDSDRESYSSSPPLDDCTLPLLPESMAAGGNYREDGDRAEAKEKKRGEDFESLSRLSTQLKRTHVVNGVMF